LAQCDPLVEAIEGEMLAAIPAGQHGLLRQSLDLGYAALAEGALPT
jgi:hypothetical protein